MRLPLRLLARAVAAALGLMLTARGPATSAPVDAGGAPADRLLTLLADFRLGEARSLADANADPADHRGRLAGVLADLSAAPLSERQRASAVAELRALAAAASRPAAERAAAAYLALRVEQWHDARDPTAPDPAPLDVLAAAHPNTFFGGLAALKAATARLASAPDDVQLAYWTDHYERNAASALTDDALRRNLHLLLADAAGRLGDDARAAVHLARAYTLGAPHRTSAKVLLTRLVRLHARLGDTAGAERWIGEFENHFPHDVLLPQLRTVVAETGEAAP